MEMKRHPCIGNRIDLCWSGGAFYVENIQGLLSKKWLYHFIETLAHRVYIGLFSLFVYFLFTRSPDRIVSRKMKEAADAA